jgi:hypothetical protein
MPSKAQYDTGFGITSSAFIALGVFNVGDEVWLRTDVVGIGAAGSDFKYNEGKMTVAGIEYETNSGGDFLDSTGAVANGSAAANVATDGTTNDTNALWPHFYRLTKASGATTRVHESKLIDVTGVNTLIDSEVWT